MFKYPIRSIPMELLSLSLTTSAHTVFAQPPLKARNPFQNNSRVNRYWLYARMSLYCQVWYNMFYMYARRYL